MPPVEPAADLAALRVDLARRGDLDAQGRSAALVAAAESWLAALFAVARPAASSGLALIAVGGLGRGEVSLGSDLDLLVLHEASLPAGEVAAVVDRLWYPIWDAGIPLDHAVRTPAHCRAVAAEDIAVLLGLIDARTIAGDPGLLDVARAGVLADWRAAALRRLPLLRETVDQRRLTHGEAAHLLEPHLKDSYGGLREATIARALGATWLVDLPRSRLSAAVTGLCEVRDGLHRALLLGRGPGGLRQPDLLRRQEQPAVADLLGLPDPDTLLRRTSAHARTIGHISDVLWHGITVRLRARAGTRARVLGAPRSRRPPGRSPLGDGVVTEAGEVVLARGADPEQDPALVMRAAAAAAQAGQLLSPATLDRLAAAPAPGWGHWPAGALDSLISLLGSGPGLVPVWESLDEAGIVTAWLPEWQDVRWLPQGSPFHRWTVDRHLVETCVQGAALTRSVRRPDLLLCACLLHDIGKGRAEDHSVVGTRIVARLAPRLGLAPPDARRLEVLVAHHLLLADTALRRDIADPEVVARVATLIGDAETLDVLAALTRADALATGHGVWSEWRAGLVGALTARVRAHLGGAPLPAEVPLTAAQRALAAAPGVHVGITATDGGVRIDVAHDDRRGLLATVAGTLALHRMAIRQARTLSVARSEAGPAGEPAPMRAVLLCEAVAEFGDLPDPGHLAADLRAALAGTLDLAGELSRRSRPHPRGAPGAVSHDVHASTRASVVEVRAHDEPALLFRLASAITAAGADITGAHVQTLGAEAVDAFYLVNPDDGGPLRGALLDSVVDALARALAG